LHELVFISVVGLRILLDSPPLVLHMMTIDIVSIDKIIFFPKLWE